MGDRGKNGEMGQLQEVKDKAERVGKARLWRVMLDLWNFSDYSRDHRFRGREHDDVCILCVSIWHWWA